LCPRTPPTAAYPLSLHDALPIFTPPAALMRPLSLLSDAAVPLMILVLGMQIEKATWPERPGVVAVAVLISLVATPLAAFGLAQLDRKSTRLNSSHVKISYAVFCL